MINGNGKVFTEFSLILIFGVFPTGPYGIFVTRKWLVLFVVSWEEFDDILFIWSEKKKTKSRYDTN